MAESNALYRLKASRGEEQMRRLYHEFPELAEMVPMDAAIRSSWKLSQDCNSSAELTSILGGWAIGVLDALLYRKGK